MNKIIIIMLVILGVTFISCSNEQEDIKNDSEIQMKQDYELPDLGAGSWYTFEVNNGIDYILVNGEKAKQIIATVNGDCEACKVSCATKRALGENSWEVECDNGRTYVATRCGKDDWIIQDATYLVHNGHVLVGFPC